MTKVMEKPESMLELADWCLRKLGGDNVFQRPVGGLVYVNVSKQQILDRMTEAVYKFNHTHYNGYREMGIILDLNNTTTTYKLPKEVISVLYYLKLNDKSTMFSFDYQMRQSMGMNYGKMGGFDLVTVELAYEWLKMVDMKVGKKFNYTFNELTHEINLLTPINDLWGSVALVCNVLENTEGETDLWQDMWLKEYSFNLLKEQWAQNLKKFGMPNLPAGVTLNSQEMYDEANTRLRELEEELETKWSNPVSFFVG